MDIYQLLSNWPCSVLYWTLPVWGSRVTISLKTPPDSTSLTHTQWCWYGCQFQTPCCWLLGWRHFQTSHSSKGAETGEGEKGTKHSGDKSSSSWSRKRSGQIDSQTMLVMMPIMKRMTIVYVKTAGHTSPLAIWCFCPTIASQWESFSAIASQWELFQLLPVSERASFCANWWSWWWLFLAHGDDYFLPIAMMTMVKFCKLWAPRSHGLRVPGQFEEIVSLCELNDHTSE